MSEATKKPGIKMVIHTPDGGTHYSIPVALAEGLSFQSTVQAVEQEIRSLGTVTIKTNEGNYVFFGRQKVDNSTIVFCPIDIVGPE